MTRLSWDVGFNPIVRYGLDRGVLYPKNEPGVSWYGLTSVETKEDSSNNGYFVDGNKYHSRTNPSEFTASVTVYTYPPELDENHKGFGFSYRTLLGDSNHYEIHLIYDAHFKVSDIVNNSVTGSPEPDLIKFDISSKTVNHREMKPTAHVIISTLHTDPKVISELEDILYGTDITDPALPTIDELYEIFESHTILRIIDHGDGTWTADGPDSAIVMLTESIFEITWPSAIYIDEHTYVISSL